MCVWKPGRPIRGQAPAPGPGQLGSSEPRTPPSSLQSAYGRVGNRESARPTLGNLGLGGRRKPRDGGGPLPESQETPLGLPRDGESGLRGTVTMSVLDALWEDRDVRFDVSSQ